MKNITVLSLEQALALPYATERMVHLGWRVIRIETPAEDAGSNAGDPNRYIGENLGYPDLHSYYIAPNIGKEAITLNLKKEEGRSLLLKIIRELDVDIFMCNTLPKRYKQLGIDYEILKKTKKDILWCGISAMGTQYPDRAGYDPALQALMGFTYLTGDPEGNPVPCGIPVIDLKAGDEAFTQILLALMEKKETGKGKRIDISMAQCAASWLITALPQLAFVNNENDLFKRSGNEHRSFIPCNIYPTQDSWVYLAIGNDIQWAKFTSLKGFESLNKPFRKTNKGRMDDKQTIYIEIGELTQKYTTKDFVSLCQHSNLSVSPVNSMKDIANLDFVLANNLKTKLPSGKEVKLFPPAIETDFLQKNNNILHCSPRLGEHNHKILIEIGMSEKEIANLKEENII